MANLAANIPDGWFQFTPDEKTLIYTLYTEGRKKDAQVYDVKAVSYTHLLEHSLFGYTMDP